MCGIAGLVGEGADTIAARDEVKLMTSLLRHRGPDDVGFHSAPGMTFGHARLSIIDLEGGKQPISNEDGTVWTVFNGEIFNYLELRRELQARGHVFRTQSDTEVLVHAYEEHGDELLHLLNGQFALALWDSRRRRLLLARDRVGICPLFVRQEAGRLAFASEAKALLTGRTAQRSLDPRAIADVLCFWSVLPPRSAFTGIAALPPGCLMVQEADGRTVTRRWWDWSFPEDEGRWGDGPGSLEDNAEQLRELLRDAVRLRLRSDVPVGTYVSGGIDSSVIAALVHEQGAALRTFSLRFTTAELDEGGAQDEMVRRLGTRHTSVMCGPDDVAAIFPRALWHAEAPLVRTAPAPMMLLAQRVNAEGYRVVLTGEGADEVFAGYDLFKEAQIRRFWARQPSSQVRPQLLSRLYPYLASSPTAAPAYARRFFGQDLDRVDEPGFGHLPRWTTTSRAWRFFGPALRDAAAGLDPMAEIRARMPADAARWHPLSRDQYVEAHTLLAGYLLSSQGDRMAMSASVEGRFPFLDHRVLELGANLPVLHKMMGLDEKHILRHAAAALVPDSIRRRRKQPYRAPDAASFFVDGHPIEYVAELLAPERLRDRGYFDAAAVTRLVDKCARGAALGFADNMAFVGVLSTMLLDEMFIRRCAAPGDERQEPGVEATA